MNRNKFVLGMLSLALVVALGASLVFNVGTANAQGDGPKRPNSNLAFVMRTVLKAVQDSTGLTVKDLREQLKDGKKTLSDIIKEKGGDPSAVIASAKVTVGDAITKAVTDGKITQDQATKLTAELDTTLQTIFTQPNMGRAAGRVLLAAYPALIKATVDVTGMDQQAIRDELAKGKSLSEIITAADKKVEDVKAAATTALTDRINKAVTDGKLTKDEGDKLLADMSKTLDTLLTTINPDLGESTTANLGNIVDAGIRAVTMRSLISEVTSVTKMNIRELSKELATGKTLSEIVTAAGGNPTAVIDAVTKSVTDQVNALVTKGTLTQAFADKALATVKDDITKLMNEKNPLQSSIGNGFREIPRPVGAPGKDKRNQPVLTPTATPNA